MIIKPSISLDNLSNNQVSLLDKEYVLPRIDAATILSNLSNANELIEAQVSLELLKTAVAAGNKEELAKILAMHVALLNALSLRLLSDAGACKSEKLTATILDIALRSFETTRKTILAANELVMTPAPVVAIQVNHA